MTDSALTIDDLSDPPVDSDVAPGSEPSSASEPACFPDLQWTWLDAAIGLVPIVIFRIGANAIDENVLHRVAVPFNILFLGWIILYPVIRARMLGAQFRLPSFRTVLLEGAIAAPSLFVVWMALAVVLGSIVALNPKLGVNNNPLIEPVANAYDNPLLWALMAFAVVVAPVCEELFFRGLIYRTLRRYIDIRIAIVIQGLLFGFMHTFGLLHAIFASMLGIGLAIVYEFRKTIVTPICMHLFQNSLAVLVAIILGLILAGGPFLGVSGEEHEDGLRITMVQPQSSADVAGIRVGGIIKSIDGEPVPDMATMRDVIRKRRVGDSVTIEYKQDDSVQTLLAVLKKRERPPKE